MNCKRNYDILSGVNGCNRMFSKILKRVSLSVVFGLLAVSLLFAQQGPGYKKFKDGETARQQKNYSEAIERYKEAISLEKSNFRYYYRKGECEMKLNPPNYDAAISSFNEAIKVNPGFTSGYVLIAQVYIKKKDFNSAITNLNTAYDKEQDQAKKIKYKLFTIKLLQKIDKPQDALKEVQALKGIASDDLRVMSAEGDVYGKLGQWEQAADAYNRALEKAKASGAAQKELSKYKFGAGLAYFKLNKTDKYDAILKDLQSYDPATANKLKRAAKGASSSKFLRMATAYLKAEDYDEALSWVNKAIEQNDNPALSNKVAGIIYLQKGQTSQAITHFSKAAAEEKDPKKLSKIHQDMIKLQLRNSDYSGALSTSTKILQTSPNDSKIHFMKAQCEYKLGQYANCIASLETALKGMPDNTAPDKKALYYFVMGRAAKKSGNNDKAKEAFAKASFGAFKAAAQAEAQGLTK